jgi:hypothetical protein
LKINPIKFAITEEDHLSALWNQFLDQLHKLDMKGFRKMTLSTLTHLPSQRQSTTFIHNVNHEGTTASPYATTIHHQNECL